MDGITQVAQIAVIPAPFLGGRVLVNLGANEGAIADQQVSEGARHGAVEAFSIDLDEADFGQLGGEFGFEEGQKVFPHHLELEKMAVAPGINPVVQAAIAKAGIGIFKLELAILGSSGKHKGKNVRFLPV